MSDEAERIISTLVSAVTALGSGDRERADAAMGEIAFIPGQVTRRRSVTTAATAAVFARDRFTCCYCGRRTVPAVVLRCVSAIWPAEFPFHPNWRTDITHVAYWTITSSLEHLTAGSRGGHWTDEENLACACWECNSTKGNAAPTGRFADRAQPRQDSDGLTAMYPMLWELAGRPQPSAHRPWLRAWSWGSGP